MKRIISEAVVAALFLIIGIIQVSKHIFSVLENTNPWPIIIGLVFLMLGFAFLIMTFKSIFAYLAAQKENEERGMTDVVVVSESNLLKRNNEMVSTWEKTNEARERLKMLQMEASSKEEPAA
jgi:hypothetical protein